MKYWLIYETVTDRVSDATSIQTRLISSNHEVDALPAWIEESLQEQPELKCDAEHGPKCLYDDEQIFDLSDSREINKATYDFLKAAGVRSI